MNILWAFLPKWKNYAQHIKRNRVDTKCRKQEKQRE